MPRKPFPMTEDEKKRYQSIYQKFRKNRAVGDEEKVFFAAMRKRLDEAGIPATDPTDSQAPTEAASPADSHAPEGPPIEGAPAEPPKAKPKGGKRKPPLEVKIPPDKLAAAIMMATHKIELDNRVAGFPGMPDVWFPVAQQLLTDYLEELQAKGWDLRKARLIILGGGFAVTGVQGVRRKVKEAKKKKTIDVEVAPSETAPHGPTNGVAPGPEEATAQPSPRSEVKGDEL